MKTRIKKSERRKTPGRNGTKDRVGKCKCGHSGDAAFTQHQNTGLEFGHGPCVECNCRKFTWAGWIDQAEHTWVGKK